MIVTNIEPVTKIKYKVFIDEQFAFLLCKGELSRYHLVIGKIIEEETYQEIRTEVILKRAKLRAMHLLSDMDRTESGLRTKLRQGHYTEDIIDQAIAYVKSFGYIEDTNYAIRYIQSRQNVKSKKEIYAGLCQKGVSRERIEAAMELAYETKDETPAIEAILRKKRYNSAEATDVEREKIYAYLMRKGFRYEEIRQVIQVSDWNA